MALVHDTVYAIRNALTHTVIDFTGNPNLNFAPVTGWGWHGGNNQKWKVTQVGNKWKLKNERAGSDRFLCPQLQDGGNYRLAGGEVAWDFDIQLVQDGPEHRILINNLAATLVTGQGVDSIQYCDRVADRHVDNSPIAFQTNDEHNEAQIWSFIPHNTPSTPPLQNNRAYKIVNSQTGTVLDVAGTVRKPVLGLVSEGGDNHKWTATRWSHYSDQYTFKSSNGHFLFPDVSEGDLPGNGTALIGHEAESAPFTVRKVPGTQLYKIFFDPQAPTDNVRGLAVNLPVVDEAPDSLDRAVVSLQAAVAQKWYFIE